jgi:MFS family permease
MSAASFYFTTDENSRLNSARLCLSTCKFGPSTYNTIYMLFKCDPAALIPIAIIYFALFFDFFLLEGFVSVQPKLAELNGWEDTTLTPMLAVCKFTMMLTCPLVALASTRIAAHHILTIGIGFLTLSALGMAFSNSVVMFALSKIAHGIASPSLTLSSMSILTYLAEETSRGQYASYGYTAISHGLLVAPFLTGVMIDELNQRWTYLIIFAIIGSNLIWSVFHFNELSFRKKRTEQVAIEIKEDEQTGEDTGAPKKDIKMFQPINKSQFVSLLRTLMANPKMLTAVTSCFLVGFSIGSNESVLPVILSREEKTGLISHKQNYLIWTSGSVAYTIFATLTGFFADRIAPVKLVYGGMIGFILTYAFMPQVCSSLVGLISHISLTGALTSFLDVAAYPLIASVVDTADIPNAYIIGYSIEYCLEQGGYAIGQYSGEPLYAFKDALEPVAYLVAGVDTFLLCFCIFVMFVYPAQRFVISRNESESDYKPSAIQDDFIQEQD